MKKGRITYRFNNGQREEVPRQAEEGKVIPLYKEEFEVKPEALREGTSGEPAYPAGPARRAADIVDTQPLNQYTTDYGAWKSPFEAEADRIEKMIRDSQPLQSQPDHDPESGYFEKGRRYEEPLRDHRYYVPEEPVRYNKPPAGSWLKITASVTGAVVTGVAFGFFVLSMFSGGDDAAVTKQPASAGTPQATVPAAASKTASGADAGAGKAATAASAGAGAATAVNIGAKTYSFLQAGVFSSQQSADAALTDLKKKGFGAASESGDKYTVYAAMALNRDDALAISGQLQQKKTEVFIKNVEVPALTKVKWTGKAADALQSCLTQGEKLLQLIGSLTQPHLTEAKPTPLDESALTSIKSAHQTWSGAHAGMHDALSEELKSTHQKMISSLNTAIVSLDEYKKNPAPSYLWQAQSAMMQYTLADKELRKALAAQ